jgi:hypothetical protein
MADSAQLFEEQEKIYKGYTGSGGNKGKVVVRTSGQMSDEGIDKDEMDD